MGWLPALLLACTFMAWSYGERWFRDSFAFDPECWDHWQTRKRNLIEIVACSAQAGPPGWLYLGLLLVPPVAVILVVLWLRRKARATDQSDLH
jgi:hypothetical protein